MAEYIDKEALRDALYDADAITMNGVKILNQFPSSDVEPVKHGRWELTTIPIPTNADRIRGLTDDELAKEFIRHVCCPPMKRRHCPDMPCYECWLNWLQQPVGTEG